MRRLSKRLASSKLEAVVPVDGEPSEDLHAADEESGYHKDDFEDYEEIDGGQDATHEEESSANFNEPMQRLSKRPSKHRSNSKRTPPQAAPQLQSRCAALAP